VVDTFQSPFSIGIKEHFGIGSGKKFLGSKLTAQLYIIIDLSVKCYPIPAFILHGLSAGIQVYNAQPAMAKSHPVIQVFPDTFSIGSAMFQHVIEEP
jgi:hypothetical protein